MLDCPLAFGFTEWAEQTGRTPKAAVLARMRIRQDAPVPVREPLVVLGWAAVPGRDLPSAMPSSSMGSRLFELPLAK